MIDALVVVNVESPGGEVIQVDAWTRHVVFPALPRVGEAIRVHPDLDVTIAQVVHDLDGDGQAVPIVFTEKILTYVIRDGLGPYLDGHAKWEKIKS